MKIKRQAILVLGMHRSGTSAFAGMLAKLGATPPKTLMPATNDNPLGYWESLEFEKFHGRLLASAGTEWHAWELFNQQWYESPESIIYATELQNLVKQEFGEAPVFIIKDPRICRFVPFWIEQLKALDITPKLVLTLRNPLEVASSLEKRDGLTATHSLLIWLRHMLDVEAATRNMPRSIIRYHDLLFDWRSVVEKLSSELDLHWPRMSGAIIEEIESYLTRSFRHFSVTQEQLLMHHGVFQWIKIAYPIFSALSTPGHVDAGLFKTLDEVKLDFDSACNVFRPLVAETIVSRNRLNTKLTTDITGLISIITSKDVTISELSAASINQEKNNVELTRILNDRELKIAEHTNSINNQEVKIADQTNVINTLTAQLTDQTNVADHQSLQLTDQTNVIANLTSKLADQSRFIDSLTVKLTDQSNAFDQLMVQLTEQTNTIDRLTVKLTDQANIINNLTENLTEQNLIIVHRDAKIAELTNKLANQNIKLEEQADALEDLKIKVGVQKDINDSRELKLSEVTRISDSQERQIAKLIDRIAQNQSQITTLTFQNALGVQKLHELLNSVSWRATRPIRYVVSKFTRIF